MELNLDKLSELAESADLSRSTGKYSEIYEQLDRAWDTLADLLLVKNATQKNVVAILQEAGLKELKIHNFNGWWSRSSTKKKREKFLNDLKVKQAKSKPLARTGSVGK